jgi:hypothetical protein
MRVASFILAANPEKPSHSRAFAALLAAQTRLTMATQGWLFKSTACNIQKSTCVDRMDTTFMAKHSN